MEIDAVVIGAGQAGLSSAYFLRHFGLTDFVVLDANATPGGAWRHRSPTLSMAEVHGIFDLPGFPFDPADRRESDPAADAVSDYFAAYERRMGLRVIRPVAVQSVRREPDRLVVSDGTTEWVARAVINATGTWTRPHWPYYPGAAEFQGRQLHYADYRGPEEFAGKRVVVVGGGNSAVHALSDLAGVAAQTVWVTRRPPVFRDGEFTPDTGRSVVAEVDARVRAGLPPQSVVSVTGLGYTTVVREALAKDALHRLPMFARITAYGVEWADGTSAEADVILWCTGFRAALDHLAPLKLREPGGGIRMDGTRVLAEPRLHLVGYGPSASTVGANRAGRAAARQIRDLLRTPEAAATV
ncbi:cation diffusion facilitator CzcD-associated flavoprotein CzcO [Hamadaea flava]|uniref:NAD(P)-binding domain-containing protein n=1 Tax=Hamadaea flava TaxID=1742688 RepID=A0ABV8LR65_9ACTN|nr:NAD(P)-binding domain-containing protein [Hamadaea flava]MCP2322380.1 cation diffusion facilitator CzcD-associated flavoprotein CzcO [Hamadaea flava]